MAKKSTGTVDTRVLADGTEAYHLRFRVDGRREPLVLHELPGCECCGGGWDEHSARVYLANVIRRVEAGVWERPARPEPEEPDDDEVPLYPDYCDWWLEAKVTGLIGEKPISPNTRRDYEWRLGFSRRFFAKKRLDEIDRRMEWRFKEKLIADAHEQREAIEAGADLRDRNGAKVRPHDFASIKKILDTHASVLDEAIEDEYRDDNPARSRRMKIHVPKPKRSFLEMDELTVLERAAEDQDVPLPDLSGLALGEGTTAHKVARLAARGRQLPQIAAEIGVARSTVTYHLGRLGIRIGRGYVGRRFVIELLGRGGLRASELCDAKIGHLRLHDPESATLRIPDSKTEAGERVVQLTPALAEAAIEHIDRLRRAGLPTGPEDWLIPNSRGGRMSRRRVWQIVTEAAKLASERLVAAGMPPLQPTSPHTLRRTYISIAIIAAEGDVKWVMKQVGHADSTMTMDVYAQLQHRLERKHGIKFDSMVRVAGERLGGVVVGSWPRRVEPEAIAA